MKRKIDFMIIGAQKAGTTSLFEYLGQHPDIFMPATKEIHYFARDQFYNRGERYLDPFYADVREERRIGGAYVHLLYLPGGPERLRLYNPDMQVIALLRNPIDRAYSAYWFARRTGWEDASTFEEALREERRRLDGSYFERAQLTYLSHGYYGEQLERYYETLGPDQVLVLLSEELQVNRESTLRTTFTWLCVDPDVSGIDLDKDFNVSGMPRSRLVQRLLRSDDSWWKRILRAVAPGRFRYFLRRHVRSPLLLFNIEPYEYPPMHPETRQVLAEHFAPHNARLGEIIGRSLTHWT